MELVEDGGEVLYVWASRLVAWERPARSALALVAYKVHLHMASALNVRDALRGDDDAGRGDVAVPAPPGGVLSSALVERDAWFEPHRTRIVGHVEDPEHAVTLLADAEELAEELGASPLLAGARRRRFYVPANFLPSLPAISVPESVALKAEQLKARLPKMPTHYFKRRMPQMPVEPVDKAD